MRGSNGTNPAAGTRSLGARSHARMLDDQTEALCLIVRGDRRLLAAARSFAQAVAEIHADLREAERRVVSANERASSAAFRAPESMLLAVA
jgi:hypothetical protein